MMLIFETYTRVANDDPHSLKYIRRSNHGRKKEQNFLFKNNQLSSFLTQPSPIMTQLLHEHTKKKLNCSQSFFFCLSHLT